MNDHCVTTFCTFLDHYTELRPDQIKRVLVFFHRIFVKRKQQVILYRLDVCELLSRMVNDEINIPRDSSIRKHLEDFVKHYMSCLVKAFRKTSALYVEVGPKPTTR
jgi:replication fork protection complex subunit Tof1/Swi1